MGTAISIDVRPPLVSETAIDAVFAWFRSVDLRFSTYRSDSEVSAIRRGDINTTVASTHLATVLALCERVRLQSDGAFDVWRHDPAGLDPSGLVKGWSVDHAATMLVAAGARAFCINAGGDVRCRGGSAPGVPWRIGLRDPGAGDRVTAVVHAERIAVATSGAYERGGHIRDPRGDRAASDDVQSVTVAGPNLALADAYATAAFAMGVSGVRWISERVPGFAAYAVTAQRQAMWTSSFDPLLQRAEAS